MELYLADLEYNNNEWQLNINELLEEYTDIIWTDRWQACGDFVLNIPATAFKTISNYDDLIDKVVILRQPLDANGNIRNDEYRIIEKYLLTYDYDGIDIVRIEGRDLTALLNRRIVWGIQTFQDSPTIKNIADTLITNAFISPTDNNRKINNFTIGTYTASDTFDAEQCGFSNILDVINEVCGDKYSPKIELINGSFVFSLYQGTDKTDTLVFSKKMDNLDKFEYLHTVSDFKNAWLIGGEDDEEYADRIFKDSYWTSGTTKQNGIGLYRREIFIDGSDMSTQDEDGDMIPTNVYEQMLLQRIEEKRLETWITNASTAELYFSGLYGVDYKIGDTALLVDPLGVSHTIRITEFIRSEDANGYKEYPSFAII